MEIKQITAITLVDKKDWNQLAGAEYPFLRHEFLLALEESGCVSEKTGWQPMHLLVVENGELLALMPLYLKSHSRGEYVFDNQWAYAYERRGGSYYPKWLTAIPFTPCQGLRIAIKDGLDQLQITGLLVDFIKNKSQQVGISSWHCLFPVGSQLESLSALGLAIREGVQFQWFNKGYRTFDDFLGTLTANKRKMIKRERRRVTEQGIDLIQLMGIEVSERQWQVFYEFYQMTYLKHGMSPYLNLDFFLRCAATMGEDLLLVFALKAGAYVGAALSFIGSDTLYGRYWGCHEEYSNLHFEACYYQGLDYCMANGLQRFDSGAQGEHKITRGFEPVTTYSAHWFQDGRFADAIADFLHREKSMVSLYKEDAANYLPFKK
jgi:uncharacterized protein